MIQYQLFTFPEKCAGCLRCQLACSEVYTRAFNPAAARIRVEVAGADCSIDFREECNCCGICADHCFYEALVKKSLEVAP